MYIYSILKHYTYLILIAFFITDAKNSLSQTHEADSLRKLILTAKEDTTKVKMLNELALNMEKTNSDSAFNIYTRSHNLAEKIGWKRGIGIGLIRMAWTKLQLGDNPAALDLSIKAIHAGENSGDMKILASANSMVGNVYYRLGDLKKALEYLEKALVVEEKGGNKAGIHPIVTNIGNIYWQTGNNEKALKYYFRSLNINKEIGNVDAYAAGLCNIAGVYYNQHKLDTALKYSLEAEKVYEEARDMTGKAIAMTNIGSLYLELGNFAEAEKYMLKGIDLCHKVGALNDEMNFEESLSQLYSKTGNWKSSLEHYKKHILLRDSIINGENVKKQTEIEMNYEFEKKTAATKAEQEKKDAVTKIVIFSISGGLLLVMILAGFIFRSYRQKKQINAIITLQKEEVEKQKILVEEKQKEILDSIHYAKRIQNSLLPTDKYIGRSIGRLGKDKTG